MSIHDVQEITPGCLNTVKEMFLRRKICVLFMITLLLCVLISLFLYCVILKKSRHTEERATRLSPISNMNPMGSSIEGLRTYNNKLKQDHNRMVTTNSRQSMSPHGPRMMTLTTNLSEYPLTNYALTHPSNLRLKRYVDPSEMTDVYNSAKTVYYQPALHIQSPRKFVDYVIGIPSIQREEENYLMTTLKYLVAGLTKQEIISTLIVIMVGEVDLQKVISVTTQIEYNFKKEINDGLIEVISPEKNFYPDFNTLPATLGDPPQRVQWRTKQNLDAVFLMSYAKIKALYYLMLEDDVVAKPNYMQEIRSFTAATTTSNADWLLIEYSRVGGIGKLFKTPDLAHFTAYVELFYVNMPLDWLIDSYVANRACGVDKNSKECVERKAKVRIQYTTSLFQHIGLHSSLTGKIQKIKDPKFGTLPAFTPHRNPPVIEIKCTIEERSGHTINNAYEGTSYFWGISPKKGDYIEFVFKIPIILKSYTIRTGNFEYLTDIFKDTDVRAKADGQDDFTVVGEFNGLGVAIGDLPEDFGALSALKIYVKSDSDKWVVISEIFLETPENE